MVERPHGDDFETAVRAVLASLKPGEIITYGEVASEAGFPGAARAVGNLLRGSEGLPWWRVVNSSGRLTPKHEERQAKLLAEEGIETRNGKIATN